MGSLTDKIKSHIEEKERFMGAREDLHNEIKILFEVELKNLQSLLPEGYSLSFEVREEEKGVPYIDLESFDSQGARINTRAEIDKLNLLLRKESIEIGNRYGFDVCALFKEVYIG